MAKTKKKALSRAKKTKVKTVKAQIKQEPIDDEDPLDKEYGPMEVIYITEVDRERLNGNEKYGKWYKHFIYLESPSEQFCFKTTVPKRSLEDGQFHPDRFEPDIVVERCERVSVKEDPIPDQSAVKFKKNEKVAIAVHGAGVVSYEQRTVEKISEGKVYLKDDDDYVFDSKTGERVDADPSPFGFRFRLVTKAEVSKKEWKESAKY